MPTAALWQPGVPSTPSVLVAVLTYQRPVDLAELLPMLERETRQATGGLAEVLVVDNDPAAGAADLVPRSGGVRYVHEPRPGIAAARNRALVEAGNHDLLVFIDDDERPGDGWLTALLGTLRAHPCCGVVGPVVSSFAVPPDPWVSAGGFFNRRRMPTGSEVTVAATNNLLLDLSAVRAAAVRFDERLGLAGGSDTLFTRRLVAAAGPLVWCDEAVVTDVVPPARSTRDWVLRRQLRSGNSWSRTALMLCDSRSGRLRLRLRLTAMGGVRVAGGPATWLLGVLARSLRHRAVGARTTARGLGLLLGAYGYGYVEYRRPAPARTPLVH
jgi:succinoglycan biosynthesis protein ExoM